jgi:hypothetical protein
VSERDRLRLTPDLTTRDLWRSRRWARERGNFVYSSLWDLKSSFTCCKILRHGTFPLYFLSERKVCCGFLSPLKIHRLDRVVNPQPLGPPPPPSRRPRSALEPNNMAIFFFRVGEFSGKIYGREKLLKSRVVLTQCLAWFKTYSYTITYQYYCKSSHGDSFESVVLFNQCRPHNSPALKMFD